MDEDNETIEERIKRYAYNRWTMRMYFKWRLEDTADDDYRIAKEVVEREMHEADNSA